jgi:hypothetical protein
LRRSFAVEPAGTTGQLTSIVVGSIGNPAAKISSALVTLFAT